ncbi:MAG: TetR/AcrR family transcriptional regulator C-terminal domain-containing protein [Alphaproteobacteria bacterium]
MVPDPDLAALQFIGIVTGPYLLPRLLGVAAPPSEAELDQALEQAVSAFLNGLRRR